MGPGRQRPLGAAGSREAVEASLRRLQVEAIDVYLSHWPDPATPYEETLGAYAKLIEAGKVRSDRRLEPRRRPALRGAATSPRTRACRATRCCSRATTSTTAPASKGRCSSSAAREGLGVITYYGLAKGFLSGKYRSEDDLGKSPRGGGVAGYLTPRGFAILGALDAVAGRHGAAPAEVALAWVMAQPGVTAPIASATSLDQLASLVRATALRLTPDDIAALDAAGA